MNNNEMKLGILSTAVAYLIWGFLPIYWKLLNDVSAEEILANRVFWSFIFMIILLFMTSKIKVLLNTLKKIRHNPKQMIALILASILISANWFIYIWAVNEGMMVEASLGYYINPLISVILGMIVLKEKLSVAQIISFILAATGVLVLTVSYGSFPWIAISLALSFGFYGLVKKKIKLDSSIGLTLETFVVSPVALGYMIYIAVSDVQSLFAGSISIDLLLMGAGVATAIPLMLFGKGAQLIPLSMVGFLQYIAPTIMLVLGVFVYNEHFSHTHLVSFLFIWSALVLYSLSKTKLFTRFPKRKKVKAA